MQQNADMPNIATLLKSEISRLARKEVRAEVEALKKASAGFRTDIAALKKRVRELEGELRRVHKGAARQPVSDEASDATEGVRFKAARLKAHRQKLGLSAKDYGRLAGASGLSIYKWESGKALPRQKSLVTLQALLTLGKREALEKLESLA